MKPSLTAALLVALSVPAGAAGTPYYRLTRAAPAPAPSVASAALFAAPFAAGSAWKSAVASGTDLVEVPGIGGVPVGLSTGLGKDGVSVPVYKAGADAVAHRVLYNVKSWDRLYSGAWKPAGNTPAVEAEILASSSPRFPFAYQTFVSQSGNAFKLPDSFTPIRRNADGTAPTLYAPADAMGSGNMDGHMVAYQPDGSIYETYATIALSDGTIVCLTFQVVDPTKGGDGTQNGVTASMIPVTAGLIRKEEAASLNIPHAMKVLLPPSLMAASYVYPALSFDRGALTENPPYSGTVPMGSRLVVPPGVDLATLGLSSAAGMAVAKAAQSYGFIVTDRGGSGITLVTEAGTTFPSSDGLDRDLQIIVAAAKRVVQ